MKAFIYISIALVSICANSFAHTPSNCFETNEMKDDLGKPVLSITNYLCDDRDVVIPKTINGIVVYELGDSAFESRELTSAVFPNTIREIGEAVFKSNNLTNIELPFGIRRIAPYAFAENKIKDLILPLSIHSIGEGAFFNNGMETLFLSASVEYIGLQAFWGNNLTEITIPRYVYIDVDQGVPALPVDMVKVYSRSGYLPGKYVLRDGKWSL